MNPALTIASLAMTCIFTAQAVDARPHDIRGPRPGEALLVKAMHIPTGCVAQMHYEDGTFLRAEIVDPGCLPAGVPSRAMPGYAHDFVTLP